MGLVYDGDGGKEDVKESGGGFYLTTGYQRQHLKCFGVFFSLGAAPRPLLSPQRSLETYCFCTVSYYYYYYYLLLLLLLLLLFLFFFSPWTCSIKFSETDDLILTKLHKKVDPHLKRSHQVLEFSKWPPLPWKPLTYVKIIDLTYIGNCQRDFHKTWHIY